MVQIYQHRSKENKISFLPVFTIKNQCNENRKNEMQKIMYKGFE